MIAARAGATGVISFAGQDWWYHGQAHCDFQIARHLAEQQPVLVVNSIGMRMPTTANADKVLARVWRKARSTLRYLRRPEPVAHPRMWVMTPVSVPVFSHERLRRLNSRLVAWQVRLAARTVAKITDPTVIVVVPTALDVVRAMGREVDVYYRADDHAATDGVDHDLIHRLESELMRTARLTCWSSRALMEAEADRPCRRRMLLDHGVEVDHFDRTTVAAEPALVATIPHPRIGFFGQIENESIDLDLLERLAALPGDPQLVLIGRVAMDLSPIERLANVHLLGWQPYADLPALSAGFDVALCPMPRSEWVRAANPIKIKEYLALGLPVVTRAIPHLEMYDHVLVRAETNDDFVEGVAAVLRGDAPGTPASRRESVLGDTWRARAAQLVAALAEEGS
jgi:glycosyltransferase involved in cell wall biosynthesis